MSATSVPRSGTSSSRIDPATAIKDDDSRGAEAGAWSRSPFSSYSKLGLLTVCILCIGTSLLLGNLGFLWFLWLANDQNSVWRAIADRNWVTRAIALASLAIRQSVSFQTSVATAMLACLALEYAVVLLLNIASVSTTRNANGGPYMLFWWLWKAFWTKPRQWRTLLLPLLVTVVAATTVLFQFTSFALLSDLDLVVVRASNHRGTPPTHFRYNSDGDIPVITHGSTWSQQLQSYVGFAEYSEPPSSQLPDGVVDTGLTLRAFLPVVDQQSRSMVAQWDGIATVLDARTMCVRPHLHQPVVHYADESIAISTSWWLDISSDPQDLGLELISYPNYTCSGEDCVDQSICMIPLAPVTDSVAGSYDLNLTGISQWRLSICQPTNTDTLFLLQSVFQENGTDIRNNDYGNPNFSFGNAYLMINVSSGTANEWALAIPEEDPNFGVFKGPGKAPLGYGMHGQNNEWYDLFYSEDAKLNLSISICYTAFDTADLNVAIEAYGNHTDLTPSWNASSKSYDYSKIRRQFGQETQGSSAYSEDYATRSIMKLKKRDSWLPEPDYGDYISPANRRTETSWITDYANMAGSLASNVYQYDAGSEQTRFMWQAYQIPRLWTDIMGYDYADSSLIGLVQEILQTGGSLAFAMQSVVTSLTELAYYQQLQQLNGVSDVTSSSYVLASAPVRMRGILAVTIVMAVHVLMLFGIILPAFLTLTKISALGNAWQAIAQVMDPKVQPILAKAIMATDKQAEEELKVPTGKKKKPKNHEIVGLRSLDGVTVSIVSAGSKNDLEAASRNETLTARVGTDKVNGGAHEEEYLLDQANAHPDEQHQIPRADSDSTRHEGRQNDREE